MKGPTETEITNGIRSLLTMLGVFHWKQWQGPMSQPKGVSDILGIYKGIPLAIEVKCPGKELSQKQKDFLERWKEEKGIAFVARSVDDVITAFGLKDKFNISGERR